MGSYQKAPQKGITNLQYFFRGSFVLLLFQLTIVFYDTIGGSKGAVFSMSQRLG